MEQQLTTKDFTDRGWQEIAYDSPAGPMDPISVRYTLSPDHIFEVYHRGGGKFDIYDRKLSTTHSNSEKNVWSRIEFTRGLTTVQDLEHFMQDAGLPIQMKAQKQEHYLANEVFTSRGWEPFKVPAGVLNFMLKIRGFRKVVAENHYWTLSVYREGNIVLKEIRHNGLDKPITMFEQEFPVIRTEQQLDTILALYNAPNDFDNLLFADHHKPHKFSIKRDIDGSGYQHALDSAITSAQDEMVKKHSETVDRNIKMRETFLDLVQHLRYRVLKSAPDTLGQYGLDSNPDVVFSVFGQKTGQPHVYTLIRHDVNQPLEIAVSRNGTTTRCNYINDGDASQPLIGASKYSEKATEWPSTKPPAENRLYREANVMQEGMKPHQEFDNQMQANSLVGLYKQIGPIKVVVYKDGSWTILKDGVSFEYENDPDYLTTINFELPAAKDLEHLHKLTPFKTAIDKQIEGLKTSVDKMFWDIKELQHALKISNIDKNKIPEINVEPGNSEDYKK